MMMKRRPLNRSLRRSFYILVFAVLVSFPCCGTAGKKYSKCEEGCEYSRRDCIERCGSYNNFGFSFDFSGRGLSEPYACTDKCEKLSESCLNNCKAQNPENE